MPEKIRLTWPTFLDIVEGIKKSIKPSDVVYGVPNGGMIVCLFLGLTPSQITYDPSKATLIIDDVIDSGETKKRYQLMYPNTLFIALFNRPSQWVVFPWEADHPSESGIESNITRVLEYLGEDVKREGLLDTPKRVVKSWKEIYGGYDTKVEDLFTTFSADGYDQIVLLKDIEFYSNCEHHMQPFFGKAHVAYIPNERVVGISKLARLVDAYSRRLQIQERIGDQVTEALMTYLKPKAAACIVEAKHMCMCARGVGKQNSIMTTSSLKGVFRTDGLARAELMAMLK